MDYKNIQEAIENNSIIKDYQGKEVELLSYSLDKFSNYKFALSISNVNAFASIFNFKTGQKIKSASYYSPKIDYSESESSSAFVKTCSRFYDDLLGNITAYELSSSSDFLKDDIAPSIVSYDNFISKYGKLHKRKYFVTTRIRTKNDPIGESFLTDNENIYHTLNDPNKEERTGTIAYAIKKEYILSSSIKEKDNAYELTFNLNPNETTFFYRVEMKTTGRLNDYPKSKSCQLIFNLSKNLDLVSATFKDDYTASLGLINSEINMTNNTIFLHSGNNVFSYKSNKVNVKVPDVHEPYFNAYDLLK